jgi:hypothetical protein
VRDEGEDGGLEAGDAQRAGGLIQGLGQFSFGPFHFLQQDLGVRDEEVGLGVSLTRRPARSRRRTPASFSSTASCWDTADGL